MGNSFTSCSSAPSDKTFIRSTNVQRTIRRSNSAKKRRVSFSIYKFRLNNYSSKVLDLNRYGFGTPVSDVNEKVILLLGELGSGKTTLINALVNNVFDVRWSDPYRFQMISRARGYQVAVGGGTASVNSYTIYPQDCCKLSCPLTIIDTPGFGDVNQDKKIINIIQRQFCSLRGTRTVDAVGIVVQASLPRLTPTLKYILSQISVLCNGQSSENLFFLLTFADSQRPQVLHAIKEFGVSYKNYYKFNNSSLYSTHSVSRRKGEEDNDEKMFDQMFWQIGVKSFNNFLQQIGAVHSITANNGPKEESLKIKESKSSVKKNDVRALQQSGKDKAQSSNVITTPVQNKNTRHLIQSSDIKSLFIMEHNSEGGEKPTVFDLDLNRTKSDSSCDIEKYDFGPKPADENTRKKKILLMGETGSGKTRLINALVNYVFGITRKHPFRLRMVEETVGPHPLEMTGTSTIASYTIYPEDPPHLSYPLTIIDTPGFADIKNSKDIIQRIQRAISFVHIDAIGLVIQSTQAKVSPTLNYILQQIPLLFGENTSEKLLLLLTHSDGRNPPALNAVRRFGLRYNKYFEFNNSNIYSRNSLLKHHTENSSDEEDFDEIFWQIGVRSFKQLLKQLYIMHYDVSKTDGVLPQKFSFTEEVFPREGSPKEGVLPHEISPKEVFPWDAFAKDGALLQEVSSKGVLLPEIPPEKGVLPPELSPKGVFPWDAFAKDGALPQEASFKGVLQPEIPPKEGVLLQKVSAEEAVIVQEEPSREEVLLQDVSPTEGVLVQSEIRYVTEQHGMTPQSVEKLINCFRMIESSEIRSLLVRPQGFGRPNCPTVLKLALKQRSYDDPNSFPMYEFGSRAFSVDEKVILFVGETRSGKSTLINAMVNYVFGVSWENPFRFQMVKETINNGHVEAAHTTTVTSYTIYPEEGFRLPCTLTLIDTPGYGAGNDGKVSDSIYKLLSALRMRGINHINAIAFVMQSSHLSLTSCHLGMFQKIASIFGDNVAFKSFLFFTFSDGEMPQILPSIKNSSIHYRNFFRFNNFSFYENNVDTSNGHTPENLWAIGAASFENFFMDLMYTSKTAMYTKEANYTWSKQNSVVNASISDSLSSNSRGGTMYYFQTPV